MTILKPKNTPSPYAGNSGYYEGYKILETDSDLGLALHTTLVNTTLHDMKTDPNWTYHIKNVRTNLINFSPPGVVDAYLTTIEYSFIGNPVASFGELP